MVYGSSKMNEIVVDIEVPEVPLAYLDDDIDSSKINNSLPLLANNFKSTTTTNVDKYRIKRDDTENNFDTENLSVSLEDLIGTFDQRISQCFKDMGEDTEEIAPVQVRTEEEIMCDSQIWWTLTGNFGAVPPLDFSKTQTREMQLPGLNLHPNTAESDLGIEISDDEELRGVLDMHQLIHQRTPLSDSPPQTAEQVIEEIDQMLQSCDFSASVMTDRTMESVDSLYSSMRSPLHSTDSEIDTKCTQANSITASPEYLKSLACSKLVTLCAEMEQLIMVYNESLVEQLAHRDELEYDKEIKNTFISLLLSIQNKRRQFNNERKRKALRFESSKLPQYMTGTIPYDENFHIDTASLQALNKLLKAIDEDNPAVPNMLTDYILTV